MTQKEILEGNKLIAEFLQLELNDKQVQFDSRIYYKTPFLPVIHAACEEQFEFHSSMDWLQPVLDKIVYNFEEFSINGSRLMTGGDHTEYECEIYTTGYQCITQARGISDNMVEAIYKACIQYIQKYNTKTLTQPTK